MTQIIFLSSIRPQITILFRYLYFYNFCWKSLILFTSFFIWAIIHVLYESLRSMNGFSLVVLHFRLPEGDRALDCTDIFICRRFRPIPDCQVCADKTLSGVNRIMVWCCWPIDKRFIIIINFVWFLIRYLFWKKFPTIFWWKKPIYILVEAVIFFFFFLIKI